MDREIKNSGRWCREKIVNELTEVFKNNASLFVTEFSGLKVGDIQQLRARIKKNSSKFMVVKNSLASRAFRDVRLDFLADLITRGQTGLILGGDDPASLSKALVEFGKFFSKFQIKGGMFNSEPLTMKQIKELALLPPRPVMLARVCFGIRAPLSRLLANLGLMNRFILTLKNIGNNK